MIKVTIKTKIRNKADMEKIAIMVADFYGLEVVVDRADFNPNTRRADLKVMSPTGKVVVLFHMSIYSNEANWSLGGQTFITADHCEEFTSKIWDSRKASK